MKEVVLDTGKVQNLGEIEDWLAEAYKQGGTRETPWTIADKVYGGYEFTGDAIEFQAIRVRITS